MRYFKQYCNPCYKTEYESNIMEFKGKKLYVDRSPEPNDLIWENLGFSHLHRIYQKFKTLILTSMLLAVCFGFILGNSYFQVCKIYNECKR
jgi:hypothetical protein